MPSRKTPLQMGEQFCQLQESRVQTYVKLNDAHKKYLQTGPNYDFKEYQNEVANATEAFKTISSKVIFIQKELEESDLEVLIKQVCLQHRYLQYIKIFIIYYLLMVFSMVFSDSRTRRKEA